MGNGYGLMSNSAVTLMPCHTALLCGFSSCYIYEYSHHMTDDISAVCGWAVWL